MIPIIVLFVAHFIGNSLFQSAKMRHRKSFDNNWLNTHVIIYTITIACAMFYLIDLEDLKTAVIMVFISYWITEFFTSKIIRKFKDREIGWKVSLVLGLTQLIHHSALILIYFQTNN